MRAAALWATRRLVSPYPPTHAKVKLVAVFTGTAALSSVVLPHGRNTISPIHHPHPKATRHPKVSRHPKVTVQNDHYQLGLTRAEPPCREICCALSLGPQAARCGKVWVTDFHSSVFCSHQGENVDAEQTARQQYFRRYVTVESRGLEIGPLTRPTFARGSGFTVQALDHASTEDLKEKYRNDPAIDVDTIADVDWVWTGGSYTDIPGIPQDFDFVISCHSIEHSLDLVQFLKDLSTLLADDGRLFLVTPHRQLMFDFYRPLTTLGDVLMGHYYPRALDMKARVDELELASVLDGRICWSQDELLVSQIQGKRPIPLRRKESMPGHLADLADWQQEEEYRDGHRWVFQPESLTGLISSLRALGMCDFEVVDFKQGVGCEFMMVLEKFRARGDSELSLQGSTREILLPPGATQTGLRVLFTILGLRALMRTVFLKTKHYAGKFLRKIGLR